LADVAGACREGVLLFSRTRICRILTGVGIAGTVALGIVVTGAAPAQAATNWEVFRTHFSTEGHDIPLRYGSHDNNDGKPVGFGVHCIDGRDHRRTISWKSFGIDIQETPDNATCKDGSGRKREFISRTKVNATYGKMEVVYTHAGGHTPDGRAGGVITEPFPSSV